VLVIHGAAVRDREAFEADVARLAVAVGSDRPFIPVFWGDLARPAEAIDEVLPYLGWLQSDEAAAVDEAEIETMLETTLDESLDDVEREKAREDGPDEDEPDEDDDSLLSRLRGSRLRLTPEGENLFERIGANWRKQSEVARRRVLGRVYRAVRDQYLSMAAHFAGDIILYQRRQVAIQARVWETLIREAPGFGIAGAPVSVITHSLGGSVAFDIAVDGHPRLHVDQLITCACTAPYFHVIGCSPLSLPHHVPGEAVTLPASIGAWTNFYLPLDPWGYLTAPVFRLADGSAPVDIEVHTGDREDRIMRHGAAHYWNHPLVIGAIRERLGGVTEEPTQ
jgi:hypothetical protein